MLSPLISWYNNNNDNNNTNNTTNNNNNKSGFKEPSSNQKPLKTLYNDAKKKEKKSDKNINCM